MTFERRVAGLVSGAGYRPDEPLVIGVRRSAGPPYFLAQGLAAALEPVGADTIIYAASLSKQVTAACAALLVRRGELNIDVALSLWLPELPPWAGTVRLRHLVHHVAALPPDTDIDAAVLGTDRTTDGVIAALCASPGLAGRPGARFQYSNTGYVCLAAVVQRAAGRPLADFARQHLFDPLSMADTLFWPGPGPTPPNAAPLIAPHPAPLSLGDGGLWSTAHDLLRWSHGLNNDRLGISALLQTPGRLDDGTPLDYAWGVGVRSYAGHRLFRHGGGWTGLRALLTRAPNLELSLITLALADDTERRVPLTDNLLDLLIGDR